MRKTTKLLRGVGVRVCCCLLCVWGGEGFLGYGMVEWSGGEERRIGWLVGWMDGFEMVCCLVG